MARSQSLKSRIRGELYRRAYAVFKRRSTPLEYAEYWIRNGGSLLSLARDISDQWGERVEREQVRRVVYAYPDAAARLHHARVISADALSEQAVEIIDDAPADRDAIAKARAQADVRHWQAATYAPQTYGRQAQAAVQTTVHLHALHLDALRGFVNPAPSKAASAQAIEAQEVTRALPAARPADIPDDVSNDAALSPELGET